jgi:hypothetical protein
LAPLHPEISIELGHSNPGCGICVATRRLSEAASRQETGIRRRISNQSIVLSVFIRIFAKKSGASA